MNNLIKNYYNIRDGFESILHDEFMKVRSYYLGKTVRVFDWYTGSEYNGLVTKVYLERDVVMCTLDDDLSVSMMDIRGVVDE